MRRLVLVAALILLTGFTGCRCVCECVAPQQPTTWTPAPVITTDPMPWPPPDCMPMDGGFYICPNVTLMEVEVEP